MHQILANGRFADSTATETFHAYNPTLGTSLTELFPVSPWEEIETLVANGHAAASALMELPASAIAGFLEEYASGIEAKKAELAAVAHEETGMNQFSRLGGEELPNAIAQLRQAAAAVRDGSWRKPMHDAENDLHSVHGPLGGPAVLFGPSCAPFTSNPICGSDFVAALAAGNPVIAKAHSSHPLTSKMLAEIALEVLDNSDLPEASVQMFYQTDSGNGLKLVAHPLVGATGFIGSKEAGLALKKAADATGKPIFLGMSSVNPVVLLPGALLESGVDIATALHAACVLDGGQSCTRPGIVFLEGGGGEETFGEELYRLFEATKPGVLHSHQGPANISEAIEDMVDARAAVLCGGDHTTGFAFSFQPTLLKVSGANFLKKPALLQSEAFGIVALIVVTKDLEETLACLGQLDGNLTASIYSAVDGSDDEAYGKVARVLRAKVGRLLNDRLPMEAINSPATVQAGPLPASNHPGFTSIGMPASLLRFTALHGYENVRADRLPEILRGPSVSAK